MRATIPTWTGVDGKRGEREGFAVVGFLEYFLFIFE